MKDAFETDVRPLLREWRENHRLAADPLRAFRESGYAQRTARERAGRKKGMVSSYA